MSQPTGTEGGEKPTTQSDAGQNAPSLTPAAPASQPTHSEAPKWATDLQTSLAALPEMLARSVKEAVGTPAKPATQQPDPPKEEKKTEEKPKEEAPATVPGRWSWDGGKGWFK